jgi:plasmid stabilization system protein ParE
MAERIWTGPAVSDLEAIADYMALDNPEADCRFVRRCFGARSNWRSTRRAARVLLS